MGSTLNPDDEPREPDERSPSSGDNRTLGPSDSSDSGSDVAGARRRPFDVDTELDNHALETGDAELDSDTDRSGEALSRSRAGRSFDIDATRLRVHLPIRIDARDALHRARRGQPLRARIAASIVARREPKPSSEHALNARRSPLGLNAASIELATFDAGFDACASVCAAKSWMTIRRVTFRFA